ncbi:hypothetical protein ACVW1C_005847 [Bradyrhizobium sp. USDA 4011]
MIRHIVFFTAKDKAGIDQIIEGLSVLTTIPHARRLEIARNRKSDQLGNDIDVVVYGEFDSEMELAAYKRTDCIRKRSGAYDRSGSCGLPPTTIYRKTCISPEWQA